MLFGRNGKLMVVARLVTVTRGEEQGHVFPGGLCFDGDDNTTKALLSMEREFDMRHGWSSYPSPCPCCLVFAIIV